MEIGDFVRHKRYLYVKGEIIKIEGYSYCHYTYNDINVFKSLADELILIEDQKEIHQIKLERSGNRLQ